MAPAAAGGRGAAAVCARGWFCGARARSPSAVRIWTRGGEGGECVEMAKYRRGRRRRSGVIEDIPGDRTGALHWDFFPSRPPAVAVAVLLEVARLRGGSTDRENVAEFLAHSNMALHMPSGIREELLRRGLAGPEDLVGLQEPWELQGGGWDVYPSDPPAWGADTLLRYLEGAWPELSDQDRVARFMAESPTAPFMPSGVRGELVRRGLLDGSYINARAAAAAGEIEEDAMVSGEESKGPGPRGTRAQYENEIQYALGCLTEGERGQRQIEPEAAILVTDLFQLLLDIREELRAIREAVQE